VDRTASELRAALRDHLARRAPRRLRPPADRRRAAPRRPAGQPQTGRANHARARDRRSHPQAAQVADQARHGGGAGAGPDRPGLHRRCSRRADRGSQYTSGMFRSALAGHGMRPSVGRTGSCFDNAVAESFFATLKTEIGTTVWATREDARRDVFAHLGYHNHHPTSVRGISLCHAVRVRNSDIVKFPGRVKLFGKKPSLRRYSVVRVILLISPSTREPDCVFSAVDSSPSRVLFPAPLSVRFRTEGGSRPLVRTWRNSW